MDLKLCRVCCEKKGDFNIFNNNGDEIIISAKIMYCCSNVAIQKGDGLPTRICSSCEADLTAAYKFILKCEATDKTLRRLDTTKIISDLNYCKQKVEIKTEDASDNDNVYEDSQDVLNDTLEILSQEVERNSNSKLMKQITKRKAYKKKIKYKESGPCKCTVCGRKCTNPSSLVSHMRSHSNDKPYACLSCEKRYKDSGTLKRHVERNHLQNRERNFICETCGKGFYSKSDVTIHMRTHTGETPYACTECPMRFTQISALLRHKKRHAGEKSYMCSTCSKRFCTNSELKSHLIVHTDKKEFSCSLCNVMFKYSNNLKKHMNLHSEPNRFICNYCGRTFNIKGNLKTHIKKQHSEKSGHCNICSKNVPNIEVHMWRHTGERPLKCELCPNSFYELKALANHMNFRHMKTDKYRCAVEGCMMAFPSKPMLDFHTAKLHSTHIPFPCDRCARGFYRKNDLARHKIGTHKERL